MAIKDIFENQQAEFAVSTEERPVRAARIPLDEIRVGERIRREFEDLGDLAQSIQEVGLIHPIVVDEGYTLLAGERRLRALKRSGATHADVRILSGLTEVQKELVEMDENRQRKSFTTYEEARFLVRKSEAVRALLQRVEAEKRAEQERERQEAAARAKQEKRLLKELREEKKALDAEWKDLEAERETVKVSRQSGDGEELEERSTEQGTAVSQPTDTELAELMGVSRNALIRARAQMGAGERYPFLQHKDWDRTGALEMAAALDEMSEEARLVLLPYLSAGDNKPKEVKKAFLQWAELVPERRLMLLAALVSPDERVRSPAHSYLFGNPPVPDPRRVRLKRAIGEIEACLTPDDDVKGEFCSLLASMERLHQLLKERQEEGPWMVSPAG